MIAKIGNVLHSEYPYGTKFTTANPSIHDPKKMSLLNMAVGRAMNTLVNVAPA